MGFPFYIAKRYLVSKSTQNAVNIINIITFLVVVIGAAALFVVLSAFAGLKDFSLSFSNSTDPDLKAVAGEGKFFTLSADEKQSLDRISGIAYYANEIEERVFLSYKQKPHVAFIKGVDDQYNKVTAIDSTVIYGNWLTKNNDEVVVGIGIYNLLGVAINDYLNPLKVLVPKPGEGSLSSGINPLQQNKPYYEMNVNVRGIYQISEDVDKKYVFTHLTTAQHLLHKNANEITGINFKLKPNANEAAVKDQIAAVFHQQITVKTRAELNEALYKMLNTENLAIYLIFTLVLIIALFNVVGAIIMIILDKKDNAKTLHSLGATVPQLRRIYFIQGFSVTLIGGFIGLVIASLLVWSQLAFGWIQLAPSLPYPVDFQWLNVLLVIVTIAVLGFIAAKIASSRINKKLLSA
ncbi:ABC transporter permease [Zhouia sp. PK063]|uniref:ABC transporter permease n=1 Tax=Zhouia sp. PK063 TaxID=3373602 RepID=UPI0037B99454